ncbi:hypothetical protein LAV72_08970 [Lysinibacillus xylanilyticus]|uniref:hypothetical protein n=1 Tax=Lysinibacillus xylanilyticus TaxID=582475 RepID=UPI002B24C73B|nr:hypothetical protein [Lysinibacillus xylanilyticus]MEB2299751.1 hypothetical protein [Lysinibacillus xylanilyticus]
MENLYEPSLTSKDVDRTRSYEISHLFFVALFGGILAIAALGIQNAKWLKIEKKHIQLLTIISIVLIIAKFAVVYAIGQQMLDIDKKYIKFIGRLFGAACFFIFFSFLNKPYKEHLAVDGEAQPLRRSSIILFIVSIIVDVTATVFLLSL